MWASGFRRSLVQRLPLHPFQELAFVLLLTLLCMMAFMSSDVFLPSLPQLIRSFHVQPGIAQLAVTFFMLGLSAFQIPYGLISDKWGRKRVLVLAFPLFLSATLGCALASNIYLFLIFRALQGATAAAYIVIPRAILTDLFEPLKAQRALMVLIPLVSLSPALAPLIGGALALHYSWHAAFYFICMFGIMLAFLFCIFVPESQSNNGARLPFF